LNVPPGGGGRRQRHSGPRVITTEVGGTITPVLEWQSEEAEAGPARRTFGGRRCRMIAH
jgi:hypothetical protein